MVKVFFSYATKDREKYQIPQLAELLVAKPHIDNVFFWEKSASGSIIEYMGKKVKESDTCVFFYSHTAAVSEAVQRERDMAIYQGKHIIPVFTDINNVPEVLRIETGINASNMAVKDVVSELYRLISIKFSLPLPESIFKPSELTKKAEKERIRSEAEDKTIVFRYAQISQFEANLLQEIEKYLNKTFRKMKAVRFTKDFGLRDIGFTEYKYKVTGIALYKCGLRTLPEAITKLESLEELNLEGNLLTTLPEAISNLHSLKKLDLSSNEFTKLPESLCKLESLQELNLTFNKLTTLPESLSNLHSLKVLNLSINKFTKLPESLCKSESLQELNLDFNKLTTLPESLCKSESLQTLRLRYNKLSTLPETIGNLTSLQDLDLENNKLSTLPESITNLKSLKVLNLSINKFTKLPELITKISSLRKLHIFEFPLDSRKKSKSILKKLKKKGVIINFSFYGAILTSDK